MTSSTRWALLALCVGVATASIGVAEQPVAPVATERQQQIEVLTPQVVQDVQQVTPIEGQALGVPEPRTRSARVAHNVSKVLVGVFAVAIAAGAAAASLLLL